MSTPQDTKPRCPRCGSTQMLYRIRRDDSVCRTCGHQWQGGTPPSPRPKREEEL